MYHWFSGGTRSLIICLPIITFPNRFSQSPAAPLCYNRSMKKIVLLAGLMTVIAPMLTPSGLAQVSGGVGANNGSGISPAETEASKRQAMPAELKDDGTSTFVEASILMNVQADEYVAVFGVTEEGKSPDEASTKMEATLAGFKEALKPLGIARENLFVDFVIQNRIYAYRIEGTLAREEITGFELKKNVSIHFKDKTLIDQLVIAAARSQIYDLIKVDYIVKDMAATQAKLQADTIDLLKSKSERYQKLLGVKLFGPMQIVADKPSVYYPVEQYDSYRASESENISTPYDRSRYTVQNARKSRTTYFNPLNGNGFDVVVNPVIIEPVIQFTTYLKVKYEAPKNRKK